MRKLYIIIFIALLIPLTLSDAWAGNKDRAGQAGASQLLVNPWARAAGLHGMNTAVAKGIEALQLNPAGLAFADQTEILFTSTLWMMGSGVNVSAAGLGQRVGESGVLGITIFSLSTGSVPITTVAVPEGNSGATFRPQLLNIGVSYAQSFSNSIHVGFTGRLLSESIANVSASGIALDMGIQYVTGPTDNIHFGIALKNIGTPMRYSGDGLAYTYTTENGYNLTANQRAEKFELPTVLNIGAAYDFTFGADHRLTAVGNFTSNSFIKDYIGGGVEYSFRDIAMLRVGYRYYDGIFDTFDPDGRSSASTGISAGFSVEVPLADDGPKLGIDYGFRSTAPFNNTHTFGVRFNL